MPLFISYEIAYSLVFINKKEKRPVNSHKKGAKKVR